MSFSARLEVEWVRVGLEMLVVLSFTTLDALNN